MLQQGLNIADVAYFIGEDAPKMTGITQPALPKGYQFDYINAEVIERDLYVKDGLLTLPHGTQYRMLVLPELKTMRPELLEKIASLLNDGAVILGPAPERSPSGKDYEKADQQVKALAENLWKGLDGKQTQAVQRGKGWLLYGMSMQEALEKIGCVPDCQLPEASPVLYAHRQAEEKDIYFLSNQSDQEIEVTPKFRIQGKQSEWWDATTGKIRRLPAFEFTEDGTQVPLRLAPFESAFIVFRQKGKASAAGIEANCPRPETWMTLDKDWNVTFKDSIRGPKQAQSFDQLIDISTHPDESIRYYSGTLVYDKQITIDQLPAGNIYLNLQDIGVTAKVTVNDQYAGGVWTPPYSLDISEWLHQGKNQISVEVTTTWQNRLIGDSRLPEQERTTWTACNGWSEKDPLQKSGLIGPVTLEVVKRE